MRDFRTLYSVSVLATLFAFSAVVPDLADASPPSRGKAPSSQQGPVTNGGIGQGPRTPSPTPRPAPSLDPSTPTGDEPVYAPSSDVPADNETAAHPQPAYRTPTQGGNEPPWGDEAEVSDDEQTYSPPTVPRERRQTYSDGYRQPSGPAVQVSTPWWLPILVPVRLPGVGLPVAYPSSPYYSPTYTYPSPGYTRRSSYPSTAAPWNWGRTWTSVPRRTYHHRR